MGRPLRKGREKPVHPKVVAGATGGSVAGLIVADLQARGVDLTDPETALLVVLFGFIAAWFRTSGALD